MSFRFLAVLAVCLAPVVAAAEQDPIVGVWAGDIVQGDITFQARVVFVSPRGGVSRYPTYSCGGILSGDRKGDDYEFTETITYGGTDEKVQGCIPGSVHVSVNGDKLKFVWSGTDKGENISAEGELRRVKRRR
ncbi:hypothetical protein GIW81_12600 [Hyphomicrobium sp. xq]|uniref:Uncharacterized protein n=1 Tax=Hyphomicrobium album TaxID=2665159 RepID=A0A6I3KN41_9HYPH|nr:hypothetical protein [Hyphomicrobium album]MTD95172.1 hypothetical protein [Hyphomicrobium album]